MLCKRLQVPVSDSSTDCRARLLVQLEVEDPFHQFPSNHGPPGWPAATCSTALSPRKAVPVDARNASLACSVLMLLLCAFHIL